VLAALIPSRRAFYRRAAITSEPFSNGWIAAVIVVGVVTTWLAFFLLQECRFHQPRVVGVQRSRRCSPLVALNDRSAWCADAVRSFAQLRHAVADPELPTPRQLDVAGRIAADCPDTIANLALLATSLSSSARRAVA